MTLDMQAYIYSNASSIGVDNIEMTTEQTSVWTTLYRMIQPDESNRTFLLQKATSPSSSLARAHVKMELNLWQQILRESSVRSKLPTANLLVAGDPESGKTALLSRLADARPASSTTGSAKEPNTQLQVDTLLAYSTVNVIDPKAKDSGGDASGMHAGELLSRVCVGVVLTSGGCGCVCEL